MSKEQNTDTDRIQGDALARIFGTWRLWLLGALIGALAAWGAYTAFPPAYRARATVVVDQNLEQAWTYFPDRQLFQFERRETARLLELAWSDAVMEQVAGVAGGMSIQDLRDGGLKLSQPSDGGWHLYGLHDDPEVAQALASAWAEAFVAVGRAAVAAAPEMAAARAQLNALLLEEPEPNDEALLAALDEIVRLAEESQGISPYTELHVSQSADLPVDRSVSLGSYLLVGSLLGALLAALSVLLRRPVQSP